MNKQWFAVVFTGDLRLYKDIKNYINVDGGIVVKAYHSKNPMFIVSKRWWDKLKYLKK